MFHPKSGVWRSHIDRKGQYDYESLRLRSQNIHIKQRPNHGPILEMILSESPMEVSEAVLKHTDVATGAMAGFQGFMAP